jgi:hypothetical protein
MLVTRDFLVSSSVWILNHKLFLFVLLPVALLWAGLAHVDGAHSALVEEATLNLRFVAWWFGLGVLSSIGLGSGM